MHYQDRARNLAALQLEEGLEDYYQEDIPLTEEVQYGTDDQETDEQEVPFGPVHFCGSSCGEFWYSDHLHDGPSGAGERCGCVDCMAYW